MKTTQVWFRGLSTKALVGAAGFAMPVAAQVTVDSSLVDFFTNGSCGRLGSTTGLVTHDPSPLMGTTGTFAQAVGVSGGPVPQGDLPTLPGTQCRFSNSYVGTLVVASDADFLYVSGTISGGIQFIDMDGPGLVGSLNASGVLDSRFTLTQSMPYRLTGSAGLDDQDVVGGLRFTRSIFPVQSVVLPQSGPFAFSGTLTPASYRVLLATNLACAVDQPDVGNAGGFTEFSNFSMRLVVGCIGVVEQPTDQTVCKWRTAQYFCSAAGTQDPTYQWQVQDSSGWHDITGDVIVDGEVIGSASGANSTELAIVTGAESGGVEAAVRCVVSNACGEKTSDAALLTVENCCAADLSGSSDPNAPTYGQPDGDADAEDYFYFLDQFGAQNLDVADVTGSSDPNDPAYGVPDHLIDASDFFYYLDLFALGCP